jgi:hypothetical protein
MGKFQSNQLISKDNSIISGSLLVSGSILGLNYISASNVLTSSYVLNATTASYTTTISIPTSSYTTFAVTSSISSTASFAQGPIYAPTVGIGYLSPNYYMGIADTFTNNATIYYPGVLYSPILITRTCTLTTMSIVGGNNGAAAITIRSAIYSQSTSSFLPQNLLAQASASVPVNSGLIQVANMPLITPITLQAGNIYWVAFASPTNWKIVVGSTNSGHANFSSANPLLGPMYSTVNAQFISNNLIASGSNLGATFLATSSQNITNYRAQPNQQYPVLMPVLKVTY